jgi:hypothetical protein
VIPLVIIVFIDAHDAATALPAALTRAVEHALRIRPTVAVWQPAADPEPSLAERGRAAGSTVAARISWNDQTQLDARVEVVHVETGRADVRRVVFEPSDALAERGRTLGLLLASVIDPEARGAAERAPPTPQPEQPPILASAPEPTAHHAWTVDAAAEGGFALGGSGSGMGGAAGVRWSLGRRLALRVGARGRFGHVGQAQASSSALAISAGALLAPLPADQNQRLGFAVRAEAMLLIESLTHLSSDDPEPVRQGHVLPGMCLLAEGFVRISPSVGLFAAAGPELAFGRTDVYVGPNRVAELAPLRLVVQAGLLAQF